MLLLDRRFKNLMKSLGLDNRSSIAIACSGGSDSMALALLVKEWADKKKGKVVALTVDHTWRKDSAKEVQQVGLWLKKHGIAHAGLPWKGRKPNRNQHEAVRKARYALLTSYCKQHKITHLLIAHHLEDQAEAFLLRLAHGGSVDGLSAMPALTMMYDVTLVRPLLTVSKSDLLYYLKKRRQAYVNDPDNEDKALDRVKVRKLLPLLAEAGISVERIAKTATIMARARAHLEEETGRFLSTTCKILPEGYAMLKHMPASEEIALRVLTTLIMIIGGQEIKTRTVELKRLCVLLQEPQFKKLTFGGCTFQPHKGGILIYRELRSIAPERSVKSGNSVLWDHRFEITLQTAPMRLKVGALMQAGWARLAKTHKVKNPCPNKNILYSLPALRDARGTIVAVPHLKFTLDKTVQCNAVFRHVM
jgi:tRNA(Ile)-lysidine synthase